MVYRFAFRGPNVVTANAHRGLPPAAEPACLPAGNPLTRVAGRNGYRPCFSLAREKRPELVVVDIRMPPTRTTEGLDTARVIHEELSDIGILVLSAHVEIGHAMADRITRVGDFPICVLSPSARSTANGSPTPRIRSPRPIGPRPPPRPVDPAGRVLPDPDARHTDLGSDLPRAGHPRQPRHRPPRSGRSRLRPRPIRRGPRATPGRFRTRVITAGVTPSLHVDDKTPRSSSTGRPRAPRPPSPTPTISGSGNDRRICPRCGRSATPPTGACSASNESATTRSPGPDALHTVTAPVTTATGTRIPGLRLGEQRSHACSPRCRCFGSNPTASPTKISAH